MSGQLCTVGVNMERLFYYAVTPCLLVEVLKKRHGVASKHLVRLVDADGNPVTLPVGCRFEEVQSGEQIDLLDQYLRAHERHARQEAVGQA